MGIKQVLRYLLVIFFLVAGVNHFIHPDFYLLLIPKYLVYIDMINTLSGVAEILLALGLLFAPTRKAAAILIIFVLIAFIPSHIYFIQIGSCVVDGLCVPAWVAWLRLLIIHPVLIWWAWYVRE